jgi:hypothetical protein
MKKALIYLSLVLFSISVLASCKSGKNCADNGDVGKYQKEVKY